MKRVLIVDDSTTMRRMVAASLRQFGLFEFEDAGNGLEAIERLALGSVDMILLDLNMPDMHGMEMIRFVQAHPTYRRIPIIVLTTRTSEDSRSAALAAGAALYMTKPFEPEMLAAQAKHLMNMD